MAWDDEEDTTTYVVVINIDSAEDRGTAPRWWLYPVHAPAGFIAALVRESAPASLRHTRWQGLRISTGLAA